MFADVASWGPILSRQGIQTTRESDVLYFYPKRFEFEMALRTCLEDGVLWVATNADRGDLLVDSFMAKLLLKWSGMKSVDQDRFASLLLDLTCTLQNLTWAQQCLEQMLMLQSQGSADFTFKDFTKVISTLGWRVCLDEES